MVRTRIGELFAICLVLVVLSSLIVPRLLSHQGGGSCKPCADVAELSYGLKQYKYDLGSYPTADQGLKALLVSPKVATKCKAPYLEKLPTDPWGHDYIYRAGQLGKTPELRSMGPDGIADTEDDITNQDTTAPN